MFAQLQRQVGHLLCQVRVEIRRDLALGLQHLKDLRVDMLQDDVLGGSNFINWHLVQIALGGGINHNGLHMAAGLKFNGLR